MCSHKDWYANLQQLYLQWSKHWSKPTVPRQVSEQVSHGRRAQGSPTLEFEGEGTTDTYGHVNASQLRPMKEARLPIPPEGEHTPREPTALKV